MKNTILVGVLFSVLAVSTVQSQSTILLKKNACYEPKYGDNAFTVLVPEDWKFTGNVIIGPVPNLQINMTFHINSPQGDVGVYQASMGQRYLWGSESAGPKGQLLNSNFQGKMYQGLLVQPVMGAEEYYNQVVYPLDCKLFQNYRVTEMRLDPSVADEVRRMTLKTDQTMNMLISSGRGMLQYQVLQIKAEFTVAGRPVEYQATGVFEYYMNSDGFVNWGMKDGLGFYAPKGQLRQYDALFRTIVLSGTLNVEWLAKVQRHQLQLKNITMDVQDYMQKTTESIYWQKSQSQGIYFQNFSDAQRGTSEYRDPFYDKPVWLPNTYNHLWTNPNGDVILTDKIFNPNANRQYNSQDWKEIEK